MDQAVVQALAGDQLQLRRLSQTGRAAGFDQRAAVRRPIERGRDENAEFVDKADRKERRVDAASAFEREALKPKLSVQNVERRRKVDCPSSDELGQFSVAS